VTHRLTNLYSVCKYTYTYQFTARVAELSTCTIGCTLGSIRVLFSHELQAAQVSRRPSSPGKSVQQPASCVTRSFWNCCRSSLNCSCDLTLSNHAAASGSMIMPVEYCMHFGPIIVLAPLPAELWTWSSDSVANDNGKKHACFAVCSRLWLSWGGCSCCLPVSPGPVGSLLLSLQAKLTLAKGWRSCMACSTSTQPRYLQNYHSWIRTLKR